MCFHALAQMIGRLLAIRFALRRQPELLQNLRVNVEIDGFGVTQQRVALGPFQVALVPVAHVLVGTRQFIVKYAVVLLVQTLLDDLVGQGQEQRTIGAGPDRHPFIRNG